MQSREEWIKTRTDEILYERVDAMFEDPKGRGLFDVVDPSELYPLITMLQRASGRDAEKVLDMWEAHENLRKCIFDVLNGDEKEVSAAEDQAKDEWDMWDDDAEAARQSRKNLGLAA